MSHIKKKGNPYIIDVSNKDVTERVAVASGEIKFDKNGMINIDKLNKVIGELKGIDIEDTTFSVESFNEYNSIISEKKIKTKIN